MRVCGPLAGLVLVGCIEGANAPTGGVEPRFDTGDAPADPVPDEDTGEIDPTPYEGPDDEAGPETFDTRAVEGDLQALIDGLRGWNATPVATAYARAMRFAAEGCPSRTGSGGDDTWIARCTTGAGASFDGYAQVDAYTEQSEGGTRWNGTFWYLAAVIHTPDGYTLGGGGSARLQSGSGADGRSAYDAWYSFLQGTLTWDGPGSEGWWIAAEPTPNVSLQAREYAETGRRVLVAEGSATVDGAWLTAVSFDDLRITRGDTGSCEAEPSGTLDLRSPGGTWFTVVYDGDGSCDGCAEVTLHGERVGEVCADWSPLTAWGASPW